MDRGWPSVNDSGGVAAGVPTGRGAEVREDRTDAGLRLGLVVEDVELAVFKSGGVEDGDGGYDGGAPAERDAAAEHGEIGEINGDEGAEERPCGDAGVAPKAAESRLVAGWTGIGRGGHG